MTSNRTRRGNNEGSIRRRDDKGLWEARFSTSDGKQHSLYAQTRQEAARKLANALRDKEQGLPIADERQTVAAYLLNWLETMRAPKLVEETWRRYERDVRLKLIPEIGRVRLARLTAQHVQLCYAHLAQRGQSSTTVLHTHHVPHRALESAYRLGMLARNVADMVERPKKRHTEMHPFTRAQAQGYLEVAESDRLAALFALALSTGMRLGELLALHWTDLDLEGRTVSVNAPLKWRDGVFVLAQPKSKYSRRRIALTAHSVEALRKHLSAQRVERLAAGPVWEGTTWNLVFCDEIGRPLMDGHVRQKHWRLCRLASLPKTRPHDLRHTAATLLLGQRINPKVVSEMLGHSSVNITLDIYSHVLPDMQQDAAAAMAKALGW
jgi:integrase